MTSSYAPLIGSAREKIKYFTLPSSYFTSYRTSMGKHDPDKLAEGIGLIAAGNSYAWVENETGIARSTLHDAYKRYLGPDAPNKDEQRKALDERILARAGGIAEATLARMASRLEQGDVDDKTLTAWHSVSVQSYGKLRGWDRGLSGDAPTDRFASVIERVLAAGGGTLSVAITPHEQQQCIDLTECSDALDTSSASETPTPD